MPSLCRARPSAIQWLVPLLVAFTTLAGPADAQVLYGSVVGRVSDTSQAVVPGARVVRHPPGNQPRPRGHDRR